MKSFISFALLIIMITSCKKDTVNTGIPYVAVNITMYTNSPSFVNVSGVGGWVYITGGYKGIILYRQSETQFMAYDRCCTYEPTNSSAIVSVNSSNIIAVDASCGSQFSIYDGSVVHSPATMPLRSYTTSFDGNVLTITN